jgi:cell division initiation protein
MTLRPEDIERQTFKERFKGYDMDEVDRFLDRVVAEFRALSDERDELARRLEQRPETSGGEDAALLQRALITAQRTADQLVDDAGAEAERIRLQARAEADAELGRLRGRLEQLVTAIEEMTHLRDSYRQRLHDVMSEHLGWLDRADPLPPGPDLQDARRVLEESAAVEPPAEGAGQEPGQPPQEPWDEAAAAPSALTELPSDAPVGDR